MPLQGINDLFRKLYEDKIEGVPYLQFLKNEGIVSNVSNMLHAAGANAPGALEDMITTLTKIIKIEGKEVLINGENTTYLKFLKDKGIMSNVSSTLSGVGAEAPEALEVLCKKLINGRILHNGKHITYLEFLKDAGIMGNVSSMLSGSGKKAPEALEDMITTLTKIIKIEGKEVLINGENTTYLKFLKDKGIMSNISSVLHKVGKEAPKASERLVNTLVEPVTIRGEEITYLESFRRYGVQYKVFSELRGKYLKSADFLDILLDQLNAKVENEQETYLEFFVDHEVLSDVIVGNLLAFQGLKQSMGFKSKEGLKERLEGSVKDFFSTALKGLADNGVWKEIAKDSRSAFLNKVLEGLRRSKRIQEKGNNSNVRSSESELPGKTDSQPRTCLNGPAVDSQLQRYSSFHNNPNKS